MKREDGLKRKYRFKEFIWNLFWKRAMGNFFEGAWSLVPLVSFPLMIDIKFGNMCHYYYKYGLKHVWKRALDYNLVLLANHNDEADTENFDCLFTEKELYLRSVDAEMKELEEKYDGVPLDSTRERMKKFEKSCDGLIDSIKKEWNEKK